MVSDTVIKLRIVGTGTTDTLHIKICIIHEDNVTSSQNGNAKNTCVVHGKGESKDTKITLNEKIKRLKVHNEY